MPRPERAVLDAFAAGLEARLDRANPPGAHPDAPALHRLNRTEYANAIRDLLAIEVDVKTLLPSDDSNEGFDNLAEALTVSPSLVQGYVAAAMKISRQAVGDRSVAPSQVTYSAPGQQTHDKHIEGLPLGTRGGLLVNHLFPLDAEYEFSVGGAGGGGGLGGSALDVTIDGEPIAVRTPRSFRQTVSAGPHRIGLALVDRQRGAGVDEGFSDFRVDSAFTPAGRRPDRHHHRPLQRHGHRIDPEPEEGVRLPSGGAGRGSAVRPPHRLDAGAPGVPPATGAGRRGHADGLLSRGARGRRLRDRHPARGGAHPGRAQVRLPHRARAGGRGGRADLRHQRPRPGLAALVLPLELDSGRSAARPGRARPPLESHRAGTAGRADAEGPEVRRPGAQLLGPVALSARARQRAVGGAKLRRQPAPVLPPRDRAALRQHPARGPAAHHAPRRRLHVRGRAPRPPLRHPERLRQLLPPGDAGAREPAPRACSGTAAC